jgi:hypothetical protein
MSFFTEAIYRDTNQAQANLNFGTHSIPVHKESLDPSLNLKNGHYYCEHGQTSESSVHHSCRNLIIRFFLPAILFVFVALSAWSYDHGMHAWKGDLMGRALDYRDSEQRGNLKLAPLTIDLLIIIPIYSSLQFLY